MARKRARWRRHQALIDPSRLVFIDETWVKTIMVRTHGWGPRGQRAQDRAPHGHWKTLTFLAVLRHDRIDTPCVLDGPVSSTLFQAYFKHFLVPGLTAGDIAILDNLGSPNGQAVHRTIRKAGAHLLFLPPKART